MWECLTKLSISFPSLKKKDFESVDAPKQGSCQKKKKELDDYLQNQTFWETRWLQYVRSGDWDWNFGSHLIGWRAIFGGMWGNQDQLIVLEW